MTQNDKAKRYDDLIKEGDIIQRELSKLQSQNAGVNTTSEEYNIKVTEYRNKLLYLEKEMNKLFTN